ncbi:hypothetical protein Rain11_2346 [Raineya orbicola]|uniref:Uncharacterized protein n=1 Tax=Raineya orbicola TaxID=2016530 RepID=A0A2N3I8B0_9BACT|nr:hypothetical protein Rain11_2346 [Raineya orbicola]
MLLLCYSCVPDLKERGYDTKKLAEEVKDRKIKKVTPRQLQTWVLQKSMLITEKLNQAPNEQIQKKWQDSLQSAYAIRISQISANDKNILQNAQGKRKAFLEAFFYELEQGKSIEPTLQKLENGDFIFVDKIENTPQKVWLLEFTKQEAIRHIDPKELRKMRE